MQLTWNTAVWTIVLVCLSREHSWVDAYSSGNGIGSACAGLNPLHGASPQTSPSPFSISVDAESYTANTPVTVTIKACTPTPFKGFLIQARRAAQGTDQQELLGSFGVVSGTQQTCGGLALVHNSGSDKTEVSFQWTTPSTQGHVQFWVTVVETRAVFWQAIKSEVLKDASLPPLDPSGFTPATAVATECTNAPTTNQPTTNAADTTTPTPTDDAASDGLTIPSGCGTSLGCVSECSGSKCETVITWRENGDSVLYTISSLVSSSTAYVSIGFSSDQTMGEDSVTGCASGSDGSVLVFNAENTGRTRPVMFDDPEVTLKQSSIANRILSCTVDRPKAASGNGKRFDVTKKWIIMFAKGSASVSGNTVSISYHSGNKFVTSSKYASSDTPNVGAETPEHPLVKAHGSLMSIAWIFFASIGIVVARYYKPVWTQTLFSKNVWFQVHRTSMALVLLTTVIGFVIIFLEEKGWSELIEPGAHHLEYHPHMGVVVTALTVLNPIMAVFRPSPDSKRRPIFNWSHWIVGYSAHILAVITIFFGIKLQKSQTPDFLVYILAGYVAWQLLVEIVLELIQYRIWEKVSPSSDESDVSADGKTSKKEESKILLAKKIILYTHVIVLVIFTSLTVAFIAIGDEEIED